MGFPMDKSLETYKLIHYSEEVSKARQEKRPIVALESTIITHGMPFPDNYYIAIEAERIARKKGCTPATIAIIDGKIRIGLSDEEKHLLARSQKTSKLTINNLSLSLVHKQTGSTTVAATLMLASLANISVFATGGIGGAHRNSEFSFDISADLQQLSKLNLIVVCAGPKAILDIAKTVEILETLGVPLISYKSNYVPAFWSQDSGVKSPMIVDSVSQIIKNQNYRAAIGLEGSQLICNPVPKKFEIARETIEPIIKEAIEKSVSENISGKDLTPFLLAEVLKKTKGASLKTNKALLLNNVELASKIAFKLKA